MITAILFLVGVASLFLFSPETTAFYYHNPVNLTWFARLITHMVSHGNLPHLLGNFVFGFPFMLYAEHKLKSNKAFLKLFFYTGLVALVGQGIAEKYMPLQIGAVIGSSGAIFGIMGFALASVTESMVARLMAYGAIAFHIFNQAFMTYLSIKGFAFGIAFAAHLSGMLAGIAIAVILRRRSRHHHHHRPKGRQRRSRSRK